MKNMTKVNRTVGASDTEFLLSFSRVCPFLGVEEGSAHHRVRYSFASPNRLPRRY